MILAVYFLIINILAFIRYGMDKEKAKKDKSRIPEKTLIAFVVFGGAFGAFLGMHIFHHKTKKKKFYITVPVFCVLWLGFISFCLWQNYHLVVTEYEYTADFDCNIVQISDLHNQLFGIGQKNLLKKIEKCDPDIIVVTGDVVDISHRFYGIAYDFFQGAVEIAPTYYVTGNHEVWLYGKRFDSFKTDIEKLGVHLLDGKTEATENMIIAGAYDNSNVLDYGWQNDSRLKILLTHEPELTDSYKNTGADIVFAGHNHGGQIIIPGKGGLISSDFKFFPEYDGGQYKIGDMTMYVSRGLGNSLAPVRINNYPEIVLLRIHH